MDTYRVFSLPTEAFESEEELQAAIHQTMTTEHDKRLEIRFDKVLSVLNSYEEEANRLRYQIQLEYVFEKLKKNHPKIWRDLVDSSKDSDSSPELRERHDRLIKKASEFYAKKIKNTGLKVKFNRYRKQQSKNRFWF